MACQGWHRRQLGGDGILRLTRADRRRGRGHGGGTDRRRAVPQLHPVRARREACRRIHLLHRLQARGERGPERDGRGRRTARPEMLLQALPRDPHGAVRRHVRQGGREPGIGIEGWSSNGWGGRGECDHGAAVQRHRVLLQAGEETLGQAQHRTPRCRPATLGAAVQHGERRLAALGHTQPRPEQAVELVLQLAQLRRRPVQVKHGGDGRDVRPDDSGGRAGTQGGGEDVQEQQPQQPAGRQRQGLSGCGRLGAHGGAHRPRLSRPGAAPWRPQRQGQAAQGPVLP